MPWSAQPIHAWLSSRQIWMETLWGYVLRQHWWFYPISSPASVEGRNGWGGKEWSTWRQWDHSTYRLESPALWKRVEILCRRKKWGITIAVIEEFNHRLRHHHRHKRHQHRVQFILSKSSTNLRCSQEHQFHPEMQTWLHLWTNPLPLAESNQRGNVRTWPRTFWRDYWTFLIILLR